MESKNLLTGEWEMIKEAIAQYIQYLFIDCEAAFDYCAFLKDQPDTYDEYISTKTDIDYIISKLRDFIPLYEHVDGDADFIAQFYTEYIRMTKLQETI